MKNSTESYKKGVETRRRNGSYGMLKGRKRPPFSEEWCKNLSLGHKGKTTWNKGLKTGPLSQEHRNKISIANSIPKKPFTQEHIDNIRKAMLGSANVRRGAKHTPETIAKIKNARSEQKLPMRDSKPERMIQIGLLLNGIKFQTHKSIKDGNGFYHQTDIFIDPNICIEIDGDYWHANPTKYCKDFIIKTRKIRNSFIIYNSQNIWNRDTLVNNKLQYLGYKIHRIWESDITKNPQKEVLGVLQLIKKELV